MSFFPYTHLPFPSDSNSPMARHTSTPTSSPRSPRSPSTPSRVSAAYSWISSASAKVPNSPIGVSVTRSSRASTISSSSSSSSSSFTSIIHHLELVSLTPSATPTSPYFSLVLRVQNHPTKVQDAIFLYSEATARCYSLVSAASTSSSQSTVNDPTCTRMRHDMVNKVISKAPQYIFHDSNFGNPWYILEIEETECGEPHFGLVATYSYQLLISSLKEPSQLYLRKLDEQKRHNLYERFNLTFVDKLSNLTCTGYLGEDDTEDTSRLVFIKMLDLGAGPEKSGEPIVTRIEQVNSIYEEINLLNTMPMHPNLTPSPIGYITLGSEEGVERQGRKIVGYVNRYYENGRLSDYLFLPGELGQPPVPKLITILQKAKWALQITSVMIHIHQKAGVPMGDGSRGFGLERFMIDEYMQLHLGGFGASEKVARTSWRVPPEARIRGEWEVEIANSRDSHSSRKLVWTRSNYVRLRWEQDNLKTMDDIDPYFTSPSPTQSVNIKVNNSANSINGISTSNKSTIGESNTSSGFSIKDSTAQGYRNYNYNKGSDITKQADPIEESDGDTACVMKNEEGEGGAGGCKEREDKEFDRKQQTAIIDKDWSAFEEWHRIPEAIEAIETYSLGVMLWLLFEQVQPETIGSKNGDPVIAWSVGNKIPGQWRALVEACVRENPADRIKMDEVLRYFVSEVGKRWDGGWLMG